LKKKILKKKKGKAIKKKEEEEEEESRRRKNTVDYCCNPQCFVCGGTMNPPHGLVYLLIGCKTRNELFFRTYICST
jgi:hypothetical protein